MIEFCWSRWTWTRYLLKIHLFYFFTRCNERCVYIQWPTHVSWRISRDTWQSNGQQQHSDGSNRIFTMNLFKWYSISHPPPHNSRGIASRYLYSSSTSVITKFTAITEKQKVEAESEAKSGSDWMQILCTYILWWLFGNIWNLQAQPFACVARNIPPLHGFTIADRPRLEANISRFSPIFPSFSSQLHVIGSPGIFSNKFHCPFPCAAVHSRACTP